MPAQGAMAHSWRQFCQRASVVAMNRHTARFRVFVELNLASLPSISTGYCHVLDLSGNVCAAISTQTRRTQGISMNQVAERYFGVWKRSLIQYRSGRSDSETAVYWLQTPRLFADLRIPSISLPSLALEDRSEEHTSELQSQ